MLKENYTKQEVASLMKGAPVSGQVEIRLTNPKKTGTITVRDYWKENADGSREFRPLIDSNGNLRVIKYIKAKKILNLNVDNDRLEYVHLLHHPKYVKCANPIIKLINYEDEAEAFVIAKNNEAKANAIINEMPIDKLKDLARVVQIRVRPGSSNIVLKRAMYEFAAKKKDRDNPTDGAAQILNQIESPDYTKKVLLSKAMEMGIVKNISGRYMFGQTGMGGSFDTVIQWLSQNPDVESELNSRVNSKIEE